MASKKLPKDVDFAAGFFSHPATSDKEEQQVVEKITAPAAKSMEESTSSNSQNKRKNLGGRPKKEGLKNVQFTLTMNPETYEKLRIVADEFTSGNVSALMDQAFKSFCNEQKIDLNEIEIDPEILENYRRKQEKKRLK